MALTLSKTPTVSAHTEPALVAAARAGDDRAFELLYSTYRERILAFILKRVRDHGRAEDIVQDVFISALRRLRASDQEISFKPWIYEIAKNACIDEFRRAGRAHEVLLEGDGELPGDQLTTLAVLPTPVAAVESKQRMNDLRRAMGGLSESHHQLLVLREFEGRSYDEIGERLQMSRQMVESGLFRARRKLFEEYDELASGRRCQQVQLAIDAGAMASARALGLRDRRRFARHLSHCQVCRNVALQGDVDEALMVPRSIGAKIAALLPFGVWRWPWRGGGTSTLAESVGGLGLGPAAAMATVAFAGIGGALLPAGAAPGHTAHRGAGAATAAAAGSGSAGARAGSTAQRPGRRLIRVHGTSTGGGGTASGTLGKSAGTAGGPAAAAAQAVAGASRASGGPHAGSTPARPAAGASGGGRSTPSSTLGSTVGTTTQQVASRVGAASQQVRSTVGATTQRTASAVGSATQQLGSTLNSATQQLGSATQQLGSALGSATQQLGPATQQLGSTLGSATQQLGADVGAAGQQLAAGVNQVTSATNGAATAATGTLEQTTQTLLGGSGTRKLGHSVGHGATGATLSLTP